MSEKNGQNQTSKRRGGFYWEGENPFVSVTNVLKVIDKPGLVYWYGQQVYMAMCKNPNLSEKEALAAPYKTSQSAAKRGSTVHAAIESYGFGKKALEFVEEEYKPYVEAFRLWIKDTNPKFLESERTIFNLKHGYAGTLDAIVEINGQKVLVDFKTNKDGNVYDSAHLQASAYIEAVDDVDRGIIVCLAETGEYNQVTVKNDFEVFLAVMKLWKYLNKSKLEKVGYKY